MITNQFFFKMSKFFVLTMVKNITHEFLSCLIKIELLLNILLYESLNKMVKFNINIDKF